jgi:hypothetical protein
MKHPLLLLAVVLLAPLAAADSKPNIRLIRSDDPGYPHVGAYGNNDIMTPNLDRFAAEANVNVAESQAVFDQHKLITFPDHRDYVKTSHGSSLSPSRRWPCRRPGPTSLRIPFTLL